MRISDYLDIPHDPQLDRFIARIDDGDADTLRRNLRDFVVTDKLREGLDQMLREAGDRLGQNKDIGRFVYGNFGSGKSHLMTVLGKMLERDEAVYDLGHAHLRALRAGHPWLDRRRCLVVRLNMMGKRTLVHALYDAFHDALPENAPRPDFTNEERIFALFEKDAERLGGLEAALNSAADSGLLADVDGFPAGLPGPMLVDAYRRFRHGSRDKRLGLAAALQTWRDHGAVRVRPDDLWVEPEVGFERMARHAQELGYDTIVWMIDELVIWLRGQQREAYVSQINTLSAMVDHDSKRLLPFFALVAVQTDIAETCPKDLSEQGFREQLSFVANRFQPALHLEEQDLFQVCAQRVLAPREDLGLAERKAYEDAVEAALRKHERLVHELAGGVEPGLVRDLYPFHPSTLRVLVDVTQALSRNRTAIAALYGLLDAHRDLAVGRFLPLASLWDILFTRDNVQALRNNERSELAQRLATTAATWERLAGKVAAVTRDDRAEPDAPETKAQTELRQIVRTALLCQLSEKPYFPDGRALRDAVTASVLYAFAQADVSALTEATGRAKVVRQLRSLAQVASEVTLTGSDDPRVDVRTRNLDVDKVLGEAKAKVQHHHRFAYARRLVDEVLGLALGDKTEGRRKITWRGTDRVGRVLVDNVRTLSYAGARSEFDPGDAAFLIAVDYPFDEEEGCTRADDEATAQRARARQTHWTVCWLPDHLTPTEMSALDDAAAVEIIRADKRTFFAAYPANDARDLAAAVEAVQGTRRVMLEQAIRRVYFDDGRIFGMKASLERVALPSGDRTRAVESLGEQILDRRFPKHPKLARRTGGGELAEVADWTIRAAMKGEPSEVPRGQQGLIDAVAVPLQLVYANAGIVTARRDGEWLSTVLGWASGRPTFDASELRHLLCDDEDTGYGFTRELADFFLFWLLQVEGYEAQEGGKSLTVQGLRQLPDRFRLVKDEVVDAPTWDRARIVASDLLEQKGRADLPSSPEQAKLAREVQTAASRLVSSLDGFLTALDRVLLWAGVGAGESVRRADAAALRATLAALVAETGNAAVVRRLASLANDRSALDLHVRLRRGLADETRAVEVLERGRRAFDTVQTHGTEAEKQSVVLRLRAILADGVATELLHDRAQLWATNADEVLAAILEHLRRVPPPPPDPQAKLVEVAPGPATGALAQVTRAVGEALASFGDRPVRVRVTIEPLGEERER